MPKPTPAEVKAEVELQLSQRRFILEAITASSNLLQVPIVTAFVWYYLSRTNATLGALNKAILAAELAPIVGDIQFPEGVLLGAAMESTDDFLNILEGGGIIPSAKQIKEKAHQTTVDAGDLLAETIITVTGTTGTCEELNQALWEAHLKAGQRAEEVPGVAGPKGSGKATIEGKVFWTIRFGSVLKQIKMKGCDRPTHPYYVSEETWEQL